MVDTSWVWITAETTTNRFLYIFRWQQGDSCDKQRLSTTHVDIKTHRTLLLSVCLCPILRLSLFSVSHSRCLLIFSVTWLIVGVFCTCSGSQTVGCGFATRGRIIIVNTMWIRQTCRQADRQALRKNISHIRGRSDMWVLRVFFFFYFTHQTGLTKDHTFGTYS